MISAGKIFFINVNSFDTSIAVKLLNFAVAENMLNKLENVKKEKIGSA